MEKKRSRARILVITGPGKGKTTAALGMIVRSLAYGKRILLVRFTKARHSGELDIFQAYPQIAVYSGEYGMTPSLTHPDYPLHVAAARSLFETAKTEAPGFDAIFLDEICGVTARGMVDESEVAAFLASLRSDQTAVLTGRGAGLGLLAIADTVSDISCVKHGYMRGIDAQEGVEL